MVSNFHVHLGIPISVLQWYFNKVVKVVYTLVSFLSTGKKEKQAYSSKRGATHNFLFFERIREKERETG